MTTAARPPAPALPAFLRRSALPLLISVAVGVAVGVVFDRVLDVAIVRRTEAGAFALLARVGPDLEADLAAGRDPAGPVAQLGRQLSLRATLVGVDGRVLGDSGVDPARLGSLENHATRPEVAQARREGSGVNRRFSQTLGDRLVYVATRLHGGEVLRLAFPEKELAVYEAPFRRQSSFLSIGAGLLVAALLIRSRFRHARELLRVRRAIEEVAAGSRPANPGPVSEETAAVFSALADLADDAAVRAAESQRQAAVARVVFDEAPTGLLVVDARLSLLAANPETLRILGVPPGAVRPGEHVLELARERAMADLLERALASGRATVRLPHPLGRQDLAVEARAIRVEGSGAAGQPAAVAILHETPSTAERRDE